MTTAHEPRRGPGTHLSAEDLSALAEGAQPSAAGAAEHLLACAACRGEVDAMSELLAQFEEWDTPPIPQEVAIRIDAALARESAARAAQEGHPAAAASARKVYVSSSAKSSSPTSSNTASSNTASPADTASSSSGGTGSSTDATQSRRRRWKPTRRLGWALTAVVLVAAGTGLGLKLSSSSPSTATSTAAGNSNSAAQHPFLGPASPGASAPNPQADAGSPRAYLGMRAPSSPLAVWTKQVLSDHRMSAVMDSPCLADPAYSGSHMLKTADGTYNGTASTLVIYANPSDSSSVIAVVYATPCTAKNYRVLDQGLVAK